MTKDHEMAEECRRLRYERSRYLIIEYPRYVLEIAGQDNLNEGYDRPTLQVQPYFTNLPK